MTFLAPGVSPLRFSACKTTGQAGMLSTAELHPLPGREQLKVSFLWVRVTRDGSWGIWRDSNWRFDFSVNGAVRSLTREVNEDDPPFPVNFSFFVDVSTPGSGLAVRVSGKEFDWGSDPLPCGVARWRAENNYGVGIHTLLAAGRYVSYEAAYRITCVHRKESLIPGGRAAAVRRKIDTAWAGNGPGRHDNIREPFPDHG